MLIYTITSLQLQAIGVSANCYLKIPGCNPLTETFDTQCQSLSSLLLFCPSVRMAGCPFSGCNNKLAKEQQALRNWLGKKKKKKEIYAPAFPLDSSPYTHCFSLL